MRHAVLADLAVERVPYSQSGRLASGETAGVN
jgi:hypothetical protein